MPDKLPISLQLEPYIPEKCAPCVDAFEMCAVLARQVIHGELTLEQAGLNLNTDLGANCGGEVLRAQGWGNQTRKCGYEPKN